MSTGRHQRREYGTVDRWLNAIVYYGFGQQLLLALPFMWLVFQQPTRLPLADATLVAMPTVAVTVGLFRLGVFPDGRPWPALTGAKLGTGEPEGYRAFARRLVTLSAVLSLAVVGGTLTYGATGPGLLSVAVVAVAGVSLVPSLDGDSLRAELARLGFHSAGLVVLAWFARPFDPSVGDPFAPLVFCVIVVCGVVDAWPVWVQVRESDG